MHEARPQLNFAAFFCLPAVFSLAHSLPSLTLSLSPTHSLSSFLSLTLCVCVAGQLHMRSKSRLVAHCAQCCNCCAHCADDPPLVPDASASHQSIYHGHGRQL